MLNFINHQQIPLVAEIDILVIGAGSAGCLAALAASQSKKYRVMLVERYGFPGALLPKCWIPFMVFLLPAKLLKK
ncbi:hypothetical protein AHMF7616_00184 [Adhaeribacter pallidiroseus]|uniref:FAD-dependent oxidoreductase 2 FAD binding domain-containing protein n=1 Tax=Adhaeribacter pallidiroseus TaxID=2072847 RepID=A0A369QA86_9BACT|nr:hypothetical protein AHMF7616_00184 [Adhaeribacter pallidiroseus]